MPRRNSKDADDFEASIDRAVDIVEVLQAALDAADPDDRLTRFEVVAGLVAMIATVAATLDDETFDYALEAVRSSDMIVIGLRHGLKQFPQGRTGTDKQRTRALLKEAFWRARPATRQ